MIAVTGATGEVGGRVAGHLAERGLEQVLVVRDGSRAPAFERGEVRENPRGYADLEGMRRALDGAETLFLVPAAEAADRVDQHRTAVDAAVAAGVGRIVYLSFVNASPDATFTLVRHHWATEEHVRATGLPCAFMRMSLYMDFLPAMAGDDGVIRGPAGDGRVAAILREDVAAACAAVLASGDHDGRTYDLTGREAFTLGEAATLMGLRYENETVEEAYASRAHLGAPDWEVEGWVTSYLGVAAGELDLVSDDVRRLTGEEPATLEQYLRRL